VLEDYLAAHAPAWRGKTERLSRALLENHAACLLAMHVADIGTKQVLDVLKPLWGSKLETAVKLRTRLEGVLEFAIAAGWRLGPNPAVWRGGLRPLLARPDAIRKTRHHPALDWQRVPAFVAALADENGNAAQALHLAVLTACRSGEVRGADWAEIDLEAKLWTIPASRMKPKRPHRIPLSEPAEALLRGMVGEGSEKPHAGLVFSSPKCQPYSDMSLLAVVKRIGFATECWPRRADEFRPTCCPSTYGLTG
jgi:integrase